MSQFEFVSVAVALLYSIGVGRLLTAAPDIFDRDRRYWIHAGWASYLLLFSASTWWSFFSLSQDFSFNPLGFLLSLAPPAFVIVRAQLLAGRPGEAVDSYRDRFYDNRVPFFSVGLASMTLILFVPWLTGDIPFGEITRTQLLGLPFFGVWIIGLATDRPRVHATLVSVMLIMQLLAFLGGGVDRYGSG